MGLKFGRLKYMMLPGRQVRLKKSWGQNLLIDSSALSFIAEFIKRISKDKAIVEFAAGSGNLTERLLNNNLNVLAVEMEREIVKRLKTRFGNNKSLQILEMNMMKFDFEKYYQEYGRLVIAGNLPYNLSKFFLFKIFDNSMFISDAVLMFQYEVARRITARPGEREWSLMSVFSGLLSDAQIIKVLEPGSFLPPPDVRSAVVYFKFYDDIDRYMLYKSSRGIFKEVFNYPRKSLRNIIKTRFGEEYLKTLDKKIDLNKRPQNLTIEEIRIICNEISRSN